MVKKQKPVPISALVKLRTENIIVCLNEELRGIIMGFFSTLHHDANDDKKETREQSAHLPGPEDPALHRFTNFDLNLPIPEGD